MSYSELFEKKAICIWEAPRSFGTAISYALHRGLQAQGFHGRWEDEPFSHYRTTPIFKTGSHEAVDSYIRSCIAGSAELSEGEYLIQKRIARRVFDPRGRIDIERRGWGWLNNFDHAFLIRDPAECLASYSRVRAEEYKGAQTEAGELAQGGASWKKPGKDPLGFKDLGLIFNKVSEVTGKKALVVETPKLLLDPTVGMRFLAGRLGLPFDERMVNWGDKPILDKGSEVWGQDWYGSFTNSTGLIEFEPRDTSFLDARERAIVEEQRPYFDALAEYAIAA